MAASQQQATQEQLEARLSKGADDVRRDRFFDSREREKKPVRDTQTHRHTTRAANQQPPCGHPPFLHIECV